MEIDQTAIILALWSALLTVFGAGMAWLVNRIFKLLDDLRKEDELIRRDLTTAYVRRDDFSGFRQELLDWMRRIDSKLDGKADK